MVRKAKAFATKITDDVNKSSPEFSFYHKVCAFFESDPDIEVGDITTHGLIDVFEGEVVHGYAFEITVRDFKKYKILKNVLYIPKNASRLAVDIKYAKDDDDVVSEENLAYLLKDNEYFSRFFTSNDEQNGLIPAKMKYVLMKPATVQYYDDIFNNPAGYDTKTAEALARELFHGSKCNISSDIKDDEQE